MTLYNIVVTRESKEGTLSFSVGSETIVTPCWWDLDKKIPAKSYSGCSATHMSNKKNSSGTAREAIWLPKVQGFTGIFIHLGTSSAWSDGCIVIREKEMLEIWHTIKPKNGANITVEVKDQ